MTNSFFFLAGITLVSAPGMVLSRGLALALHRLRGVLTMDPEIGLDLVELGLVYEVGVHGGGQHTEVLFSLTSPLCPVAELRQEQVETDTISTEGVEEVHAQITFDPLWTPEMMSPAAKLFFGC